MRTTCSFRWRDASVIESFRTAVSLHGHTQQSKEYLDFIPRYARKVPIVSDLVKRQTDKYERIHGKPLNFMQAWWTPPLSPREAWNLESRQIEKDLGLRSLVSLTDHDDIGGPLHLRVLPETRHVPVSMEWTVPFGPVAFHLGIHNIPEPDALSTMEQLNRYTQDPQELKLGGLLASLSSFPGVLIVLNHPLWDEAEAGADVHRSTLERFLRAHGSHVHAAELNGLRPWKENAAVIDLARSAGLPIISGGDRHGCEANANVNLTNASTFDEFVDEVRNHRTSRVLFLDQYREPFRLRLMQGLLDAVREYPDFPAGRRWTDRVYFQQDDGTVKTLSALWKGDGPAVVRGFMTSVRLLQSRRVKRALRYALAERMEQRVT